METHKLIKIALAQSMPNISFMERCSEDELFSDRKTEDLSLEKLEVILLYSKRVSFKRIL